MGLTLIQKLILAPAVLCTLGLSTAPAWAVDSMTLVEKNAHYDGRMITFRGEVIGDVMRRREGVWLNVNDDAYSRQGPLFHLRGYNQGQGILLPKSLVAKAIKAGNYRQRGDIIEVTGIFYAAAKKYGGQMMIEGRSLKVIKRGFPLESPISRRKIVLAIVSITAAATIMGLSRVIATTRRRT